MPFGCYRGLLELVAFVVEGIDTDGLAVLAQEEANDRVDSSKVREGSHNVAEEVSTLKNDARDVMARA